MKSTHPFPVHLVSLGGVAAPLIGYAYVQTRLFKAGNSAAHGCDQGFPEEPGSRKVTSSANSARSRLAISEPFQSKIYRILGTA